MHSSCLSQCKTKLSIKHKLCKLYPYSLILPKTGRNFCLFWIPSKTGRNFCLFWAIWGYVAKVVTQRQFPPLDLKVGYVTVHDVYFRHDNTWHTSWPPSCPFWYSIRKTPAFLSKHMYDFENFKNSQSIFRSIYVKYIFLSRSYNYFRNRFKFIFSS